MPVNEQITDTITQVDSALSTSSALAAGNLQLATGQALALAAHNATRTQQQGYALMQATTVAGINSMVALGNALFASPRHRRK